MGNFSSDIRFCFTWRSYQARVLSELEGHLDDNHLHVIAAPGSGKTVLGLEVLRRLDKPAIIFAPTIAIRDQWVDRFANMFCPAEMDISGWISRDIRKPRLLTVSTYQGLHSAYTGRSSDEEESEGEEERKAIKSGMPKISAAAKNKLIESLKKAQVSTIVLDEAHHLRKEWWKCLIDLKEQLSDPVVVALTATPPLDVTPAEWARYNEMCGAVDSEICVPELVFEKNLCPHQDYVYVSTPLESEKAQLNQFHTDVSRTMANLFANEDFAAALSSHPCLRKPRENIEAILAQPRFCTSMAVFLNHTTGKAPRQLLKTVGIRRQDCPQMNLEWMEVLLGGCLYAFRESFADCEELFDEISRQLKRIGAIERRQVHLRSTSSLNKMLISSISKLDAIERVVRIESDELGDDLRMVILTDFIRKADLPKSADDLAPLRRIGVAPIFETIRRSGAGAAKLGILSGSMVVVPRASVGQLEDTAKKMGIDLGNLRCAAMKHDEDYCSVELKGEDRQQIVRLITSLFNAGGINVLVGTRSLLGEGWDAPSINCLVLASFVGSYMLSNQMRGRAIRTQKDNPDKTANIWHLVCTETDSREASHDLATLRRRFNSFVGVSFTDSVIENGIDRLDIGGAPFSGDRVEKINDTMIAKALDRAGLQAEWTKALGAGGTMVEEVAISAEDLPRKIIRLGAAIALGWQAVSWAAFAFCYFYRMSAAVQGRPAKHVFTFLAVAFAAAAVAALGKCLKAFYLFFKHRTVASSMKQIGKVLLKALARAQLIRTPVSKIAVCAEETDRGGVTCWIAGATTYEKSLYLDAMQELMGPIEDARYLISARSPFRAFMTNRYRVVPKLLGKNKETAEHLGRMWSRHIGSSDVIYTRSAEGKGTLLKAKAAAMNASTPKACNRIKSWK